MKKELEVFKEHAFKYDQNIDMVKYKYLHSLRVMDISGMLATKLQLSKKDMKLAKFIGLTHDIARFEQWTKYQTFYDVVSFDHGLRAVEILFEENLIKEFGIKDSHNIIEAAIYNHNKFAIDKDIIDEKEILYSKIIRDADKLDIIYSFSSKKVLELENDDSEISKKVRNDFLNNKPVNYDDLITQNDRVVEIISLIYDINFRYSLDYIIEKKYLEIMYKNLKNKNIFKEYFDYVNEYIDKRRNELC